MRSKEALTNDILNEVSHLISDFGAIRGLPQESTERKGFSVAYLNLLLHSRHQGFVALINMQQGFVALINMQQGSVALINMQQGFVALINMH